MSKERLIAFTDAVMAIVMTILVLELKSPNRLTWQAFWQLRASYFAYAISFFWLGAMWVVMHNEWHDVKKVNVKTIWASLILLFASSLFPYVTEIVSRNFTNKIAQMVYGIVVLLITLANMWMYYCIWQANHTDPKVKDHAHRRLSWMIWDLAVKLIGMLLSAFVFPPAMMWSVLLTLLVLVIPNQFKYHN